jgi:hypothetical protein
VRGHWKMMLLTAALAVALAVPATAARPGSSSTSAPTLTGPTVAHVGETYTIDGSGFAPGSTVPLEIMEADGCCMALNMVADDYGKFSYTDDVWAPGAYRVRALVKRSNRWRVAAEWSFQAYP